MPIPNLLVATSLFPPAPPTGAAHASHGDWPELAAKVDRALAHLAAQRAALLTIQLPRVERLWSGRGERGRETFAETLELLAGSQTSSKHGAEPAVEALGVDSASASDAIPDAEYVRLNTIKAAADDGVRKLAHTRVRLSSIARRLELRLRSDDAKLTVAERRALETGARLAAAAAVAARQPLLPGDGGIDRRYSTAMRQLPG